MAKEPNIDKYLDKYATKLWGGSKCSWWWNADDMISEAIASAARHVRKDGCHHLSGEEKAELKQIEEFFGGYTGLDRSDRTARAFTLLGEWFPRLWD